MSALLIVALGIYGGIAIVLATLLLAFNGAMGSKPSNPAVLLLCALLWPLVMLAMPFMAWLENRATRRHFDRLNKEGGPR